MSANLDVTLPVGGTRHRLWDFTLVRERLKSKGVGAIPKEPEKMTSGEWLKRAAEMPVETEVIRESLAEAAARMMAPRLEAEASLSFLNESESEVPFKRPIVTGNGCQIWGYCTIAPTAKLGKGVIIGAFTNICGDVKIGDNTRIQGFCFMPQGLEIGERVFVGPNVTFANVKYPMVRYGHYSFERVYERTYVERGASIGAGCVICPGVRVGAFSLVAAGSVVTQDVMPGWLVKGNPARHIRLHTDPEKAAGVRPLDGTDHGWEKKDAEKVSEDEREVQESGLK